MIPFFSIIFYLLSSPITYNIYFANLHSHTLFSDGQGTPVEAFTYARDSAKIDILALTDHTSYITENSYQYIRNIANQYTHNDSFVALAGQEFGSLNQFGHVSIFEAESLCPVPTPNLTETYNWINQHHSITQFNHPSAGDFNYFTYDFNGDEYCSTIEVVNGSGDYTVINEQMYFLALANGWHVAPVANQDNHRKKWGDATTSDGAIPLTGIWAESLTKTEIINALFNRRVYAMEVKPKTDRIRLKDFSIDNTIMGSTYRTSNPVIYLRFEVVAETGFAQIYLYKNGVIYDSVNSQNQDSIAWYRSDSTSNAYYLIKGIQLDGDQFWSAPIWVEFRPKPNTITIYPNPLKIKSKISFPDTADYGIPTLEIYKITGEKVYEKKGLIVMNPNFYWYGIDQNERLLPNGVYLVCIKFESGGILKAKIAIER